MPTDVHSYAEAHGHVFDAHVPELIVRTLERERPKSILDAGCGDGSLLSALEGLGLLQGRDVFAADLSPKRVGFVKGITKGIVATVDSVEELTTVVEGSIDFFISTQVIEHVDDVKMIRAIERVTHPGSFVYVNTVMKAWYGWYFYRHEGRWVLDPTHVREYAHDDELVPKFDRAKFELLENVKTPLKFAVADPILRRLGARGRKLPRIAELARSVRVPIPGYSVWELLFRRT